MLNKTQNYLEELTTLLDDIYYANNNNISVVYTRKQVADLAYRIGNDIEKIINSDNNSDTFVFETLQSSDELLLTK